MCEKLQQGQHSGYVPYSADQLDEDAHCSCTKPLSPLLASGDGQYTQLTASHQLQKYRELTLSFRTRLSEQFTVLSALNFHKTQLGHTQDRQYNNFTLKWFLSNAIN